MDQPDTRETDRRMRISIAAALVALIAVACSGERGASDRGGGPTPMRGGTASVCLPTASGSLDPFVSPDQPSLELAALLYTPLVRYAADGSVKPYLARSWRWDAGHRELTFRLRTDVTWHDSTKVTATDVVFTVRRAADPAFGYPGSADFADLDTVFAADSSTVVLRFERPYVLGLEPFTEGLPILPAHILSGMGPEAFSHARYHHAPVGSGPYRYASGSDADAITFARWNAFPAELGPVRLDRVVVRVVPDASTRAAELRTGGVDACVVPASQVEALRSIGGLRILAVPPELTQALILDTRQAPLRDVRVRRAISAALDRSELAALVSPVARPARGPLPLDHPYVDSGALQPDRDPALADSLLASAGWTSAGAGQARTRGAGRPLRLTLAAPTQFGDVVTVLQAQLARVGIQVEPRLMEFASLIGELQDPERTPPAVLLGFAPDHRLRPDFYTSLVTGGSTNTSGYSNAAVDSAAAALATATDSAEIAARYAVLQERVARDLPIVYTIRVPHVLAVGSRLRGVEAGGAGPFGSVASWWVPGNERK